MSDETAESLSGSFYTEANGWVRVHVEGDPSSLGFQHGYHLASELDDTLRRIRSYVEATCGWSWIRFREVSKKLYDAKVPCEYRQEMEGIAKGANTRLRNRGIWGRIEYADILALNGFFDSMFYYNWTKVLEGERPQGLKGLGHCSAFVASGKATVDGRIVLAHNMWLNYDLANWNILLSLHPLKGHKIFMQTMPGSIQGCGVDWYINSGGLMVTNTTLTGMKTFNQDGVPYFVRARRGIQHADSIGEWVKILVEENNGGDAAGWLVGDCKTGEIAYLELGTYEHSLQKTRDGYFYGCNMAYSPNVREETSIDYEDRSTSSGSRYERWRSLLLEKNGGIDVEMAKVFLADHYDPSLKRDSPSRGTLCGHVEDDERGWPEWDCGPFHPFGTTDGFVTDSELAANGSFWSHWGKPCGINFIAKEFLNRHPGYGHLGSNLKDIIAYPWTLFKAGQEWGRKDKRGLYLAPVVY